MFTHCNNQATIKLKVYHDNSSLDLSLNIQSRPMFEKMKVDQSTYEGSGRVLLNHGGLLSKAIQMLHTSKVPGTAPLNLIMIAPVVKSLGQPTKTLDG